MLSRINLVTLMVLISMNLSFASGGDFFLDFNAGFEAEGSLSIEGCNSITDKNSAAYLKCVEGVVNRDCPMCANTAYLKASQPHWGVQLAGILANPAASVLNTWMVTRTDRKNQEGWMDVANNAQASWTERYQMGEESCNTRFNQALSDRSARGGAPFTAEEYDMLMGQCNGQGWNQFSGMGGQMSTGYGGVGNPYLANGYSSGYMNGMVGPYGGGMYGGGGQGGFGYGYGTGGYGTGGYGTGGYGTGGYGTGGYGTGGYGGAGANFSINGSLGGILGGLFGGGVNMGGVYNGGYNGYGQVPQYNWGAGVPNYNWGNGAGGYGQAGGNFGINIGAHLGGSVGGGWNGNYSPGGFNVGAAGGGGIWGAPGAMNGYVGAGGSYPYNYGGGSAWNNGNGWGNGSARWNQQYQQQQQQQQQQYQQWMAQRSSDYEAQQTMNERAQVSYESGQRNNQVLYQAYVNAGNDLQSNMYNNYYGSGGYGYGAGNIGGQFSAGFGAGWNSNAGGYSWNYNN